MADFRAVVNLMHDIVYHLRNLSFEVYSPVNKGWVSKNEFAATSVGKWNTKNLIWYQTNSR